MPYASIDALPDPVKTALPKHGQEIWLAAFNSAMEQYDDEEKAAATAWAAVKTKFEKDAEGNWRAKEAVVTSQRMRLREAFVLGSTEPLGEGDFRVEFLRAGATADGQRYYPKRVLESAHEARVFEGAKMYFDHSSPEDIERGTRSVRDWGATIRDGSVRVAENGLQAVAHVHHPDLLTILSDPVAKAQVGLSHESMVSWSRKKIDGRDVQQIEAIHECYSVDWVPAGNAHGRVIESKLNSEGDADMTPEEVKALIAESLKDVVPQIVAEVANQAAEAKPPEKPEGGEVVQLQEASAATQRKVQALEDEIRRRDTQDAVRRICEAESKLPAATKARVIERFAGRIIEADKLGDEVQAAIAAEQEYAKILLREAGLGTKPYGGGADPQPRGEYKTEGTREWAEEHGMPFFELPGEGK